MNRISCLLFVLCISILAGCAGMAPYDAPVAEELSMAQDVTAYAPWLAPEELLLSKEKQVSLYEDFIARRFAAWEQTEPRYDKELFFYGLDWVNNRSDSIFAENKRPAATSWIEELKARFNAETFPSISRPAIVVRNSSLRLLPTNRPLFYDFRQAGEGFPFDYLQNSGIYAGEPVYACHLSRDKDWVLVESRFALGWLPAEDVAFVDEKFIQFYRTGKYVVCTTDRTPIATGGDTIASMGRVGALLPVAAATRDAYMVLIPWRKPNGAATAITSRVDNTLAAPLPLLLTPSNMGRLANQMLGDPYGWGGLYGLRDCSALIMDLFTCFGVYLPRNSRDQSEEGQALSLDGMSAEEKAAFLLEQGKPFRTLLYKPGHIMLYIGRDGDDPVVLHSLWGLKTENPVNGEVGRHIIGKVAVTTLRVGQELPNLPEENLLMETISQMILLGE